MNRLFAPFTWFFQLIIRCFRAVFGDVSWQPPGWGRWMGAGIGRRPVISTVVAIGVIGLAVCGGRLWQWYAHRPVPMTVSWIVKMWDMPAPGYVFQSQNLTLNFEQSVAKLELIGKDVTKQVTLSPKIDGKWTWMDGANLVFTPAVNWPAQTRFQVKLSPELFSRHAKLETLTKEFRTLPMTVRISEMTFYVDPKDPSSKQVTATLTFSHPVDRASLEKSLTLAMESGEQVFQGAAFDTGRCTFTYDMMDRIAYVRSVNITVPKQSGHAVLTVPESVQTTARGEHLELSEWAQVLIPSAPDLFHIASASPTIVTNREGEPEQALVLTTTVGVKPVDLANAMHAWILPKPKKHSDAETESVQEKWKSVAEITPEILAKAKPVDFKLVPSQEEYATLHSFKLKVPENSWVYVQGR